MSDTSKLEDSHRCSPVLVIHAGAGFVPREALYDEYKSDVFHGLNASLDAGLSILLAGGSALDAVQAAVVQLEECPRFNAGRGSVLTAEKRHELDASIMEGSNRRVGAVIGVTTIRNPIKLARAVMEKSTHVTLACEGAEQFADSLGSEIERVSNSFFTTPSRQKALEIAQEKERKDMNTCLTQPLVNVEHALEQDKKENLIELDKGIGSGHSANDIESPISPEEALRRACEIETKKCFGTVGAVALDCHGVLSAATSTGGMTNKKFGRVGDSPLIGCGTWADDTVAVSGTGWGEFFIRNVVAHDIAARVKYAKVSLKESAHEVINVVLVKHGGDGGAICVDKDGNIAMPFSSGCMFRGWVNADGSRGVAIYDEELIL